MSYLKSIYDNAEQIVNKYGLYASVSNSQVDDIWSPGGALSWATSAESLEILSSSSDDAAAGTGAQQVTVYGLNSDWEQQSEVVTMNGTNAVALTKTFLRVFRMRVTRRGTYTSSNAGNITLRASGGGATKAQIRYDSTFGGVGSTEMSHYTIPAGYTGYLTSFVVAIEASKPVDFYAAVRINTDDFTSPIGGEISYPVVIKATSGESQQAIPYPYKFPEKTDLWGRAKATGATTGFVQVRYQILLVRNIGAS